MLDVGKCVGMDLAAVGNIVELLLESRSKSFGALHHLLDRLTSFSFLPDRLPCLLIQAFVKDRVSIMNRSGSVLFFLGVDHVVAEGW